MELKYNIIFKNIENDMDLVIQVDGNCTIENLIKLYLKRSEKGNLIVNNIERTYYIYNGWKINYENNFETI